MKIRQVQTPQRDLPKCCAPLSQTVIDFWGDRPRPGNKAGSMICQANAKYKIGNKYFCRKHAGLYLLDNFTEVAK